MEFGAKLDRARVVSSGNLSEVCVRGISIEAVIARTTELRVVENVEALEPQFQVRPPLFECEGFEQGHVEIDQARSHDRVFPGSAKALVGPAIPGSGWIGKRAGAEPCEPFLWVGDRGHKVRTVVDITAAQTQRVGARVLNEYRISRAPNCHTGELPAAQGGARGQV